MLDVLLVDDDDNLRESLATALINAGHQVTEASDGAQAAALVASHVFDLAICDVQMPKLDGLTLFRHIRRGAPDTAVVMMTGFARIPDVVDSLRDGALDFVTKPFDPDDFAERIVTPIAEHRSLRKKFDAARAQLVSRSTHARLVAVSRPMRALADRVNVLAGSDAALIITGDRGTGKELVARTIHSQSARRDGPFVVADGILVPEMLAADADGGDMLFRSAAGGTLVLDGVEQLPRATQSRLLRIISEPHTLARRGPRSEPLGVRLVTLARERLATHVEAGRLLEPLYYRLNGVQLHVPSLEDRAEDFCLLVAELLGELQQPTRTVPALTAAAWKALAGHAFPGNVRELRWILEHALAMSDGHAIDVRHFPQEISGR